MMFSLFEEFWAIEKNLLVKKLGAVNDLFLKIPNKLLRLLHVITSILHIITILKLSNVMSQM